MKSISIPFTSTADSVCFVIEGQAHSLSKDHPKFPEISEAIFNGDDSELLDILSPIFSLKQFSGGKVTEKDGQAVYQGFKLHEVLVKKIQELKKAKLPFTMFESFLARIHANPEPRSIEQLYNFLEHEKMPITENGTFLAYKGVRDTFYSDHGNLSIRVLKGKVDDTGRIFNGLGEEIEIDRSQVDPNPDAHCSNGLHVGSYEYAKGFASKLIVVEVDPKDVVSIPKDCNGQKCRVCRYKVVAVLDDKKQALDSVLAKVNGSKVVKQAAKDKCAVSVGTITLKGKKISEKVQSQSKAGRALTTRFAQKDLTKVRNYVDRKLVDERDVSLRNVQSIFSPYCPKLTWVIDIVTALGYEIQSVNGKVTSQSLIQ